MPQTNQRPDIIESYSVALNPTVIKLGLVSFFADVASEMLYPVTPIFLTTVLGASMASVGLVEGFAEAVASLMKIYSGSWSDQIGRRKPFILAGYFLGAIGKPMIGFSTSWFGVLAARAIDRTGKGLRSAPRDALIADSVMPQFRGAAFGWHRGMDTLGAVAGPLLTVFFLSTWPGDLRSLYFWALIPGALSVLLIFFVKEKKESLTKEPWQNPWAAWSKMSIEFKQYLLAWGVFSLANSSDVFLLMKAKESGLTMTTVILLFCAYNLTYALSSPKLGHLSDRIPKRHLLVGGLLIFAAVYAAFGYAHRPWHFWILILCYGFYMGATDGVGKAFAVELSPLELKGTSLGIMGTVTGLCTIIASVAAGIIWDKLGGPWPFLFGAIGALIAVTLLLLPSPARSMT